MIEYTLLDSHSLFACDTRHWMLTVVPFSRAAASTAAAPAPALAPAAAARIHDSSQGYVHTSWAVQL
jgi:hypothetical protein